MEQAQVKKMLKVEQNECQEDLQILKKRKYKYFPRHIYRWVRGGFKPIVKKREPFQNSCADLQGYWQDSDDVPYMKLLPKRRQKLSLSVSPPHLYSKATPHQNYPKLREVIKRYRDLQTISLRSFGFSVDPAMKEFIGGLKSLHSVRNVRIAIDQRRVEDEELQQLGRCLARMTTLKHIEFIRIDLPSQLHRPRYFPAPVKGLHALGHGLKRLNSLQEVKLACWKFEGQVLQGLGQGLKGKYSPSAKVNLIFHELCDVPNVEILKLGLLEWSSFKDLGLDFTFCTNPNPRGLMALGENFPLINLLKRLTILLLGNLTTEVFEVFTTGLQALSQLETLDMNSFYSQEVSDKGLKSLSKTLKKLPSLKDLRFMFSSPKNLTKEGFQAFREGIEGAKSLEKLDLALQDSPYENNMFGRNWPILKVSPEVDDQDISQFMQSLEMFPSLTNLTLNLANFELLGSKGLSAIGSSFQRMSSLQKIWIAFYNCKNMSKKSLVEFLKKLESSQMKIDCIYDHQRIESCYNYE